VSDLSNVLADASAAPVAAETRGRFFRRLTRDRAAVAGGVIVAAFLLAAIFAPLIAHHDPNKTDFLNRFAKPSRSHPFGTDHVGRDEFARILFGARLSLGMAITATVGITFVGIVLGLAAAVYGRVVETVIMRVVDVLLALPTLILALVIVGLLGQGLRNLLITIIFVQWPRYARLVRGMALKVREREFVEAGRAAGASRGRLVRKHILPNLIGPVVVFSTIDMGATLLAVSGLAFLGFGISPPTPEWGSMLSEARFQIERAPQLLLYPGIAITLVVLAFNLAGDGLRDLLDPRTQALERRERGGILHRRPRRPSGPLAPAELEATAPQSPAWVMPAPSSGMNSLYRTRRTGESVRPERPRRTR
jgi:peptide/nickel transport system permease protein